MAARGQRRAARWGLVCHQTQSSVQEPRLEGCGFGCEIACLGGKKKKSSNHFAAELSHFGVETVRHSAQGATRGHCFPEKIRTSKKLQLLAEGSPLVFKWGSMSPRGNPQDLFGGLCNHVIGNTYEQNCTDHMQFYTF